MYFTDEINILEEFLDSTIVIFKIEFSITDLLKWRC